MQTEKPTICKHEDRDEKSGDSGTAKDEMEDDKRSGVANVVDFGVGWESSKT